MYLKMRHMFFGPLIADHLYVTVKLQQVCLFVVKCTVRLYDRPLIVDDYAVCSRHGRFARVQMFCRDLYLAMYRVVRYSFCRKY